MRSQFYFPAILVALFACRKDPDVPLADTTPYVINYPERFEAYLPPINIPADNPLTEEGVELGRMLFFDERLSANNTQSCGSCHMPEFAFGDTAQYSVGIDGLSGNRNAPPIFNIGWMQDGLFWDGRAASAENQVFEPVVNPIELHTSWPDVAAKLQADDLYPFLFERAFGTEVIDSVLVAKAISQFERTLISGNAPYDKYLTTGSSGWNAADEFSAYLGFAVFMDETKGDCFHCHGDITQPLYTDNIFHNNGLDAAFTDNGRGEYTGNASDNGKFKTPSLRNLLFTAPYMHDGRFQTLSEVIEHYSTGLTMSSTIDPLMKHVSTGGSNMTPEDKGYLLMFLKSLSDSSFVNNPDFQDPG
jgi:cytochrome c peroxidase